MNNRNLLDIKIADIPIRIILDNPVNFSYIKSAVKNYIEPVRKPYFCIHINTLPPKKYFVQEDSIEIARKNDRFIFKDNNAVWPNQDLGFIDKKQRISQLNLTRGLEKVLFHPFLTLSCALFLSEEGGFIVHASGIIYKSDAYIFVGPAGSGKTTVASMLKKKGLVVISDEKIVVRKQNSSFKVFSFPWYRDKNQSASLKGIFFLKKSRKVGFKQLGSPSAISRILPEVTFNIPGLEFSQKILDSLLFLFERVPVFEMQFKKDDSFWLRLKDLN